MPHYEFFWHTDNISHLAEHGVAPLDAEHVVKHARPEDRDVSESSGNPVAFGYAPSGQYLCVVYQAIDPVTMYVVTAFEVPSRGKGRRK